VTERLATDPKEEKPKDNSLKIWEIKENNFA